MKPIDLDALCDSLLVKRDVAADRSAINAGTGPCSLCACDGYADDGSGFSRCKCGDRKMDHRSQDDTDVDARALTALALVRT